MRFDLSDKVIVLTGCTGTIGEAIKEFLSACDAKMVLTFHDVIPQMEESNNQFFVKADITDYSEVKALAYYAIEKYQKIDVLINNAGICDDANISDMTLSQWENVFKTNVFGTFHCCKIFSDIMKEQKNGKIFNIASIKGIQGCERQVNYCASKAAIINMTKTLAKELGEHNVLVNSICPGFVKSKMNNFSNQKYKIAQEKSAIKDINPLITLVNFMGFACSDDFIGVSGQNFILDSRIL